VAKATFEEDGEDYIRNETALVVEYGLGKRLRGSMQLQRRLRYLRSRRHNIKVPIHVVSSGYTSTSSTPLQPYPARSVYGDLLRLRATTPSTTVRGLAGRSSEVSFGGVEYTSLLCSCMDQPKS